MGARQVNNSIINFPGEDDAWVTFSYSDLIFRCDALGLHDPSATRRRDGFIYVSDCTSDSLRNTSGRKEAGARRGASMDQARIPGAAADRDDFAKYIDTLR
jgi:hypothetical protein